MTHTATPPRNDLVELIATLGHDLRTPLNAILGYCELLGEELGDAGLARLQDDVRRVSQCGEHLGALLDALVDLARIERGKAPITLTPVDLERVVLDALAPLRPPRRPGGPPLDVVCDADFGLVTVDPRRLPRALLAAVRALMDSAAVHRVTISIARRPGAVTLTAQPSTSSAPDAASPARLLLEGDGGVLIARALCAGMAVAFAVEEGARIVFTIPEPADGAPAPPAAP